MSTRSWLRRAALAGATAAVAGMSLITPAQADPVASVTHTGTESAELTALLSHIPAQIRPTCTSIKDRAAAAGTLPAGALEWVFCSTGDSANPVKVTYLSFQDSDSLKAAWTKFTPATSSPGTCQDGNPGKRPYTQGSSQVAVGEFSCFQDSDGTKELDWVQPDLKILAAVFGPQDYAQLYQTWRGLGPVPDTAASPASADSPI